MAGISLKDGCTLGMLLIQTSISGKLNRKEGAVMEILTAPFMQMVLNWRIIKIPIIGGSIPLNYPLVDGGI